MSLDQELVARVEARIAALRQRKVASVTAGVTPSWRKPAMVEPVNVVAQPEPATVAEPVSAVEPAVEPAEAAELESAPARPEPAWRAVALYGRPELNPRFASPSTDVTISFADSEKSTQWRRGEWRMPFDRFAEKYLLNPRQGDKNGSCFCMGTFREQSRSQYNFDALHIAVLDLDSGNTLAEIAALIRDKGLRAVVHSSFSHLKAETLVSKAHYDEWQAARDTPGPAPYLVEVKHLLPRVAEGATLAPSSVFDENGAELYAVQHAPCGKFRVAFPLAKPFRAKDYADQRAAIVAWHGVIYGLGSYLGVPIDVSCIDPSRLFFLPRSPDKAGLAKFESANIYGRPLDISELPKVEVAEERRASLGTHGRVETKQVDGIDIEQVVDADGEVVNLRVWAGLFGDRFLAATALATRRQEVIGRRPLGRLTTEGGFHFQCPRNYTHTNPSERTGTYIVDAGKAFEAGLYDVGDSFTVNCMHNACSGIHDRLVHLAGIIGQGWLKVADLTDPAFLKPEKPAEPHPAAAFLARIAARR